MADSIIIGAAIVDIPLAPVSPDIFAAHLYFCSNHNAPAAITVRMANRSHELSAGISVVIILSR
jgi:hypothetical protein